MAITAKNEEKERSVSTGDDEKIINISELLLNLGAAVKVISEGLGQSVISNVEGKNQNITGFCLLDDKKAALILDRGTQTMRNWRCQRRGPAYIKIGRNIGYDIVDLLRYKEAHRIDPEAD